MSCSIRRWNAACCLGPAAIYLSGGLDSVSVAAVAAQISQRKGLPPPWALSLGFPAECNEEEIQRGVAKNLGLPQVFMTLGDAVGQDGLLLAALKMNGQCSMPLLNPWYPAYHRLGLEGKQRGCKVILTGGGGDEWLGVSPFLAADLMRSLDVVGLYRLWSTMQSSYPLPWYSIMRKHSLDVRSEAFARAANYYGELYVAWLRDYCGRARGDECGGQHQTGWLPDPVAEARN